MSANLSSNQPRLAYSIAESAALTGVSRASLYRLMAAGLLKTVQLGKRRLVPAVELERILTGTKSESPR